MPPTANPRVGVPPAIPGAHSPFFSWVELSDGSVAVRDREFCLWRIERGPCGHPSGRTFAGSAAHDFVRLKNQTLGEAIRAGIRAANAVRRIAGPTPNRDPGDRS